MNNEFPQRSDAVTEEMRQQAARQQIAAEQAQQNARFLAAENDALRTRVVTGSDRFTGLMHMIGFLMAIGAIAAAVLFLTSSARETNQQAAVSRQEAEASRQAAIAANQRANTALDTANRAGQRSQAATAAAQQAASAAMRAEQNAQRPIIVNPPPPPPGPPTVILTPAEPATPAPVTEIPDNSEPKPLEGRIE